MGLPSTWYTEEGVKGGGGMVRPHRVSPGGTHSIEYTEGVGGTPRVGGGGGCPQKSMVQSSFNRVACLTSTNMSDGLAVSTMERGGGDPRV